MLLNNVLLIGLRASGKSTVGARVAQATTRAFVDLDHVTAERLGCTSAAQGLTTHGEAAFRAAEFLALRETLKGADQIIAAGGGTPTAPGAAELLVAEAVAQDLRVVYLRAHAATLAQRLQGTNLAARPSLTGAGTVEEVASLHAQRDELYVSLADLVIEIDTQSAEQVAGAVQAFLEE